MVKTKKKMSRRYGGASNGGASNGGASNGGASNNENSNDEDIKSLWTQYGDLCVRPIVESNRIGNWYFVTNKYTDIKQTKNTNKRIINIDDNATIINDTTLSKDKIMTLNDPALIRLCEQNIGNDFGIINTDKLYTKTNESVTRYLSVILERVNSVKKQMSFYIIKIKNIIPIDTYLPHIDRISSTSIQSLDIGPESPGIHFGGILISKMSGPISTYYLRPKQSMKASEFPLLLLFGDRHHDYESSCSPCDDMNLCYKISDPELLKKIDTESTPEHPIDFYTESFKKDTGTGFKDGYMEELTTKYMTVCSNHKLKTTQPNVYSTKCPTKNIRWQGGDVRQALNETPESFFNSLYPYIKYFNKRLGQNMSVKLKNKISEFHKFLGVHNFTSVDDLKNLFFPFNIKNSETLSSFKRDKNISMYDTFENLIYTKFTSNIFNFLEQRRNSLIIKQIGKQTYPKFKNIEFWKDLYKKSLKYDLKYFSKDFTTISRTIEQLFNILQNSPDKVYDDFTLTRINLLIIMFESSFVNIYTLARILKKPTDGIRSSMSICYLGQAHIINMVQLLKDKDIGYDVVYGNSDEEIRCQTYREPLYLTKDLKEHNDRIDEERQLISTNGASLNGASFGGAKNKTRKSVYSKRRFQKNNNKLSGKSNIRRRNK